VKAFVADQSGNFGSVAISAGADFTVIGALPLAPGSYVVFANIALAGSAPDSTDVQVTFLLDGTIYGEAVQDVVVGGPNGFLVVPLTTGLALDEPRTLQVACRATAVGVASQPTTIAAIQVESVARIRDQQLT
jgi:hypothetical protein